MARRALSLSLSLLAVVAALLALEAEGGLRRKGPHAIPPALRPPGTAADAQMRDHDDPMRSNVVDMPEIAKGEPKSCPEGHRWSRHRCRPVFTNQ